jgi:hypothetical protein
LRRSAAIPMKSMAGGETVPAPLNESIERLADNSSMFVLIEKSIRRPMTLILDTRAVSTASRKVKSARDHAWCACSMHHR